MQPLTLKQYEAIEQALVGMRAAYNHFDIEPCHFSGIPEDLSSLDYIPYELPVGVEYAAGSLAFSLVWGHILDTSFEFSWVTLDDCDDPRCFALQHENPSVLVFPYYRLLEFEQSIGGLDSPAELLWFNTIRRVDLISWVPDGWHPVFDAVQCPEKIGCPASATKSCQRLVDMVPEFYDGMSTYPYQYARNKEWDKLAEYADRLATDHELNRRQE